MKIAVRAGVFETNSSSSHSLILVWKELWEEDKANGSPRFKPYDFLVDKRDKLYMACGCCQEIFEERGCGMEEEIEQSLQSLQKGERLEFYDILPYETQERLLIEEYCAQTGEAYEAVEADIRALRKKMYQCHRKFFEHGALDDSEWDYDTVARLFHGTEKEIRENIAAYLSDDYVLGYREFWGGSDFGDFE